MSAILIDYTKIVSKDQKLQFVISPPPSPARGFSPGLIVLVENEVLDTLSELKPGQERLDYINTDEFMQGISDHYYIMYNEKREICIIGSDCESYLPKILLALFSGLPPETLIWVGIDLSQKDFTNVLDTFVSNGFNSPYVTTLSPMYGDIPASAALTRQNIPSDPDTSAATVNKVLYSIQQYKDDGRSCYLFAKLSPRAIGFLKEASKIGITVGKDGKKSQKELTGELYVKDVLQETGKFTYVIDIDKSSVESGQEENVDVSATRYNFHSHPHEAYVRHSVDNAWPSVTDYLGYHKLGNSTIFHCVATLEGLYVMSFSPHWGSNLKKVNRKFIDKNFEIDHKEPYTPDQYVDKINAILYKGYPIFDLKYFPWEKADSVFKVFYAQTGSSCLPCEQIVEKYKKLHAG
jgi:hypothetical protein